MDLHYGKIQTKIKITPTSYGKPYGRENGKLPDLFRREPPERCEALEKKILAENKEVLPYARRFNFDITDI